MSTTTREDFGLLLHSAFGAFKKGLHAHLAKAGYDDLGSSFGFVFRKLDAGPMMLRALAEQLDMTPQGALKIVNDMVAKGYLERLEDVADGRVKQLVLTARARKVMALAAAFHHDFETRLGQRLGSKAAETTRKALEDIVAHYQ
jgi:DNA-binding MarR family transcriptional regulator